MKKLFLVILSVGFLAHGISWARGPNGQRPHRPSASASCAIPKACDGVEGQLSLIVEDLDSLEKSLKGCTVASGCITEKEAAEPKKWAKECKEKLVCFEKLKKAYKDQNCNGGWGGQTNTYTCSP